VPDNNEPTLRNALDAVNSSRKWALLGITSLFFAITIALAVLNMMFIPSMQQGVTVDVPSGTPSIAVNRLMPLKVLWVSSAIQLLFVTCATIAVMLHVSRMTRAILRAIETLRK
jgi:hypothetical protein